MSVVSPYISSVYNSTVLACAAAFVSNIFKVAGRAFLSFGAIFSVRHSAIIASIVSIGLIALVAMIFRVCVGGSAPNESISWAPPAARS